MNNDFSPKSHLMVVLTSFFAFSISIPLFLTSKSSMVFLSATTISAITACLIYFTDICDIKIKRFYYPFIAALYFILIIPILDAFGIHGGYKSEHLNIPQTVEWYANSWMQFFMAVMVLIIVHSLVKWADRRND